MAEAAVQLKLAGQTYRVVTSADETDLTRLARVVEDAIFSVTTPGRQPSPQAVVLAAITLAHELEQERARREQIETRHREMLTQLLTRIDRVLDETKGEESADAERESPSATAQVARVAALRMSARPVERVAADLSAADLSAAEPSGALQLAAQQLASQQLASQPYAAREIAPEPEEPALSLARSDRGRHGGARLASDAWKLDGPSDR